MQSVQAITSVGLLGEQFVFACFATIVRLTSCGPTNIALWNDRAFVYGAIFPCLLLLVSTV